jgi:DNA-binding MarR family transcriptional regulator
MARATLPKPEPELTEATLAASRALLGVIVRSLAPALDKVSLPQLRVLVILAGHGTTRSGTLAELVGVHASTFSRTTDRLAAGGWVRRVPNPQSRRETLVELTDSGRRLVASVTQRRRTELAVILRRVPVEQRPAVRAAFDAFAEASGEPSLVDLAVLGA